MKRNANTATATTADIKARNAAMKAAAAARAAAREAALEAEPEPTAEQLEELAADYAAGYAADVRAELGSQLPKAAVAQHTTTERKSAERSTHMKRNANTATVAATAATATASTQNTTERKSAERSTHMKRNTVTVAAIDTAWKFTPASIALNGHVFTADKYAIAEKGDVYVLAKVEGVAVRIHVGKASPVYHEALEAAVAFKAAAETKPAEPAKPVETKAAEPAAKPSAKADQQAKPATKRKAPAKAAKQPEAKAAEPAKPVETKPAPAAKQPKAATKPAEPAKPVVPADNAWIGTVIEGKGWRIAFDEAAQRTRVIFAADPSAKQKAAIDAAGFYWSNTTKSWNKKLTRKAYRAAQALAETLNAIK